MQFEFARNIAKKDSSLFLGSSDFQAGCFCQCKFVSNEDLTPQYGYMHVLMDGEGKSNVLQYGSIKPREDTRTVSMQNSLQ